MSTSKIIELDENNTCKFCNNALAKYSCPKCSLMYCSVSCYQSETHLECSEEFYKKCIAEELLIEDTEEGMRKMQEILQRTHDLSGSEDFEQEGHLLDSDDDEEFDNFTDRLAGVNLDNAEDVWDKLTEDERQEFAAFIKSKDITKYVPPWEPWWLYSSKNVEDVADVDKFKSACPQIIPVKDFRDISKKDPADCVKFNLINVLAAYIFATRYFNGEFNEFVREVVTCLVTISLVFKDNQNFEDFETAVKSVEFECTQSDWIIADVENFKLLREDLEKVLKGPNVSDSKFYILSALSDMHSLLNLASTKKNDKNLFSKTFPNNHFPTVKVQSKNKIKNCVRKLEYLLSFAKDVFTS